jgi:hypothetical protein
VDGIPLVPLGHSSSCGTSPFRRRGLHKSIVYEVLLCEGGSLMLVTTECGPPSLERSKFCSLIRIFWQSSMDDAGELRSSNATARAGSALGNRVHCIFAQRRSQLVGCSGVYREMMTPPGMRFSPSDVLGPAEGIDSGPKRLRSQRHYFSPASKLDTVCSSSRQEISRGLWKRWWFGIEVSNSCEISERLATLFASRQSR